MNYVGIDYHKKYSVVTAVDEKGHVIRMSKQTRFEIIRDFMTQLVYSRAQFPMGSKGLKLKDGVATPNGQELHQHIRSTTRRSWRGIPRISPR